MISPPPNQKQFQHVINGRDVPESSWVEFFSDLYRVVASLQGSGVTANRPTMFLWTGRPYFDTTLGYEIHYNGAIWVKYDGTAA